MRSATRQRRSPLGLFPDKPANTPFAWCRAGWGAGCWQCVLPQERRWINPRTGEQGRHHVHESLVQKAVKQAAHKAHLTKRITSRTFRHSFATHLLADGYDIRTVQESLGHSDVKRTMIYTHVLNRGGRGARSPADGIGHRTPEG